MICVYLRVAINEGQAILLATKNVEEKNVTHRYTILNQSLEKVSYSIGEKKRKKRKNKKITNFLIF